MLFECGPIHDRRLLNIDLPDKFRIGVFVSGGIDSALLYYLLMKMNFEAGNTYQVIPFTVLRKEGSSHYANPIINYINSLFGKSPQKLIEVGNNALPEDQQVRSGVIDVLKRMSIADTVYVGVIQALDIHMEGWSPIPARETPRFKTPFKDLNKSHVIDLVYQLNQEWLFHLSHSCIHDIGRCGQCNGCNERSWAFAQLSKTDPGTI
jgi:hypothetical protein